MLYAVVFDCKNVVLSGVVMWYVLSLSILAGDVYAVLKFYFTSTPALISDDSGMLFFIKNIPRDVFCWILFVTFLCFLCIIHKIYFNSLFKAMQFFYFVILFFS